MFKDGYVEWIYLLYHVFWMLHHPSNLNSNFYSFFTSTYLPSLLEVERTSMVLNADDVDWSIKISIILRYIQRSLSYGYLIFARNYKWGLYLLTVFNLPRGSENVFSLLFWCLYIYATPKQSREHGFRATRQKIKAINYPY